MICSVAVFDVVTISNRRDPIVLLQPRPPLTELFTSPSHRSQIASLPDSTYVGLIGKSLYAMSHLNYPLVAFSRRGGSRSRATPHSRSELAFPNDDNSPCTSLKCLVGTHQSEYAASSRLSRLLDSGTKLQIDAPEHHADSEDGVPISNSNSIPPTLPLLVAHPSLVLKASFLQGAGVLLCGVIGYLALYRSSAVSQKSSLDDVVEVHEDVAPNLAPIAAQEGASLAISQYSPTTKTFSAKQDPRSAEESDQEDDLPADSDGLGKSRRKQKPRNRGRGKKGKSKVAIDEGEVAAMENEKGVTDISDDYSKVDMLQMSNPTNHNVAGAATAAVQKAPLDAPAVVSPRPIESSLTVFEGPDNVLGTFIVMYGYR